MMTVDIRIFRSDDHARARALWEQDPGVGLSSADSFENIARFLERNREMSLVALDDDALIATILCGHDGRRGLIHHLAVAPAYRRRGIARSLVDRALAALRREGIQKCHLLVFNDNQAGHAFWRSIGAEERTTLGLFSLST
jgi:ribosomal protein S18 acetylase RimI-like enzyme